MLLLLLLLILFVFLIKTSHISLLTFFLVTGSNTTPAIFLCFHNFQFTHLVSGIIHFIIKLTAIPTSIPLILATASWP